MPNSEPAGPDPSGGSAGPQDNPSDGPVVPDNKIDDAPAAAIAEVPLPGPNTGRILPSFGMRKNHAAPMYLRSDDYEQKYQPDRIEDALGPNARVWRVYLDEAQVFDNNMMEGWRDTIDVLLVFAGLFSAVVTTFVVQTSQDLQPDYSEISAMLLSELVGLQRAIAEGQPATSVPLSSQNATSFVAQKSDKWINGLWFTSLALSLATALMSVLVKQWLQYYMMPVSGPSQEQVHVRQFRYAGIKLWHVGGIIGCLPVLMHLALMLFYIGLVVFVVQLNKGIAAAVAVVAGLAYIAYFATNLWAVINVQCPYKTPLSDFSRLLLGIFRPKMHQVLHKCEVMWLYIYKYGHSTHETLSKALSKDNLVYKDGVLFTEKTVVHNIAATLDIDALVWLSTISSNTSIAKIIYHSLAAIDLYSHNIMPLISIPTIEYCLPRGLEFFENERTVSYNTFSLFWADMMICASYLRHTGSEKDICTRYYDLRYDKRKEYALYVNVRQMVYIYFNASADRGSSKATKYITLFEDMSDLSTTEDWLWKQILDFVTQFIVAEDMSASELVHIGLWYLKFSYKSNHRSEIYLKRLHFLLKNKFSTANNSVSTQTLNNPIPPSIERVQNIREIFDPYFENIDKWVDDVSDSDINILLTYWLEHRPRRLDQDAAYLEQSIRILNCGRIYNKLPPTKIERIVLNCSQYLYFSSGDKWKTAFQSLNESFLLTLTKWTEKEFNNPEEFIVSYLKIINYSDKFRFWYSHNIIDFIPDLPIFERLWEPANDLFSHLYSEVSCKVSGQFLDWYCKLFLSHVNAHKSYVINNSKFLELMEQSLEHPIWIEFLASIIEKYNQTSYIESRITTTDNTYDNNALYFEQLIYLNQMKIKLNVSPTDSRFILYAYVSGEDIGRLKPLDGAQYAPYSIVFESRHTYSKPKDIEDKASHSVTLKLQSSLAFKAVQKVLRFGRASEQVKNTELVPV